MTPYDELVEPYRADLALVIDSAQRVRERESFRPRAESVAADEIANESHLAGAWSPTPAQHAHSGAALLLLVSADNARGLCFTVGEALIFAPLTLARAVIDTAARSASLTDLSIDLRTRVARWQTERLYDIDQRRRFGEVSAADAGAAAERITTGGREHDYMVDQARSGEWFVGNARLRGGELVRALLPELWEGRTLAHVGWNLFSATAHGAQYAQKRAIKREVPLGDGYTGYLFGRKAENTILAVATATIAFVRSLQQFHALMGWSDDDHDRLCADALERAMSICT